MDDTKSKFRFSVTVSQGGESDCQHNDSHGMVLLRKNSMFTVFPVSLSCLFFFLFLGTHLAFEKKTTVHISTEGHFSAPLT